MEALTLTPIVPWREKASLLYGLLLIPFLLPATQGTDTLTPAQHKLQVEMQLLYGSF